MLNPTSGVNSSFDSADSLTENSLLSGSFDPISPIPIAGISHSRFSQSIDSSLEHLIQALVSNASQATVQDAVLPIWQSIFSNPNFSNYAQIAFGDRFNQSKINALEASAFGGDLGVLPDFQLLSGEVMGNTQGAFSAQTHSIYLNRDFAIQNLNNPSAVADVVVEELGHSIDSVFGAGDAQGDEGEILAKLTRNGVIEPYKLQELKAEDDSATIIVNRQQIAIEQARIDGYFWGENLIGTNSNDEIYGNGGDDRIEGRNGDDKIWGGNGNDKLWGENGSDRLIGDEGDDEVNGGANNDYLWGSQGNDKLWGEDGNDELRGDDGNDELRGGGNNDKLWGGNGNDKLWGENDNDELYGESGNDELNGGRNDDKIWGGSGNDKLWGENGSDRIIGDEGDDEVNGGGNDDYLWGSQGNDKLWGEDGNDELRGDDGNDELRGGGNNDKLWGGNSDDKLWGENDNDELYGESGNDELNGGRNDDKIFGGPGNDRLWGESGNDALYGDDGDDILDGYGNGDNERDLLAGWAGRDRFILGNSDNVYYRRNGRNDFAEIFSFNRDEDIIQLKSLSNNVSNGSKAYGYRLVTVGSDTEIRVDSNDDLIAILRGVTGISLTGKGFAFDGSSPQEIIKQLYRDVFGREADPGGLQISSNQLASGVMTYEQIRQAYAYSPEGKDKINQIYQDVLWRVADQGGLDYYRNNLATGTTLAQIRSTIASSQEAKKFWTIQYYNNTNLDGDVVFAQSVTYNNNNLSRNWGSGSPNSAVNRDNFSARATTKRYFNPGSHQIQTISDDGVRVWINNQLLIDKWIDQSSSNNYGYFNTAGGTFDVTIDYYERSGDANLSLYTYTKVDGSIGDKYRELGGVSSFLGLSTSGEFNDIDGNTIRRQFQGGQIVHNKSTGKTEAIYNGLLPSWLKIEGLIGDKYRELGGASSLLKYSISSEFDDSDGITIRRQFQGGQIVNNKLTGETEAIYNGDLPSWLRYESLAKDEDKVYSNNRSYYQPYNYHLLGNPIENSGTGFYAIGLISNDLNDGRPPVLVFRGTNPTEAEDLRDDLNINGIGRKQFDNAKLAIRDWLDFAYQKTKIKPDVIGHSLGGALAQRTAGEFTDKIGKVVTFNSPGIGADNVRDFENRGGRNLKVVHYITAGDPVSFGGEKFLPGIMIRTQGQGGIPLETASNLDLLSAYVGATLASKTTNKFTTAFIDDSSKAASIKYNHLESVVKLTNQKVVISVDDFQYNPKRLALEVARKELGLLLATYQIKNFWTEEIIKLSIRLAAK